MCTGGHQFFTLSQRVMLIAANAFNKQVVPTPGGAAHSGVKCNVASWQWPFYLESHAKSQGPLCARIDVGQCVVEGQRAKAKSEGQ